MSHASMVPLPLQSAAVPDASSHESITPLLSQSSAVLRRASEKVPPAAAIATEPEAADGMVDWPKAFQPHAMTSSSAVMAIVCCPEPEEIFFTPLSPAGTLVWPKMFEPHARTVPSERRPTEW